MALPPTVKSMILCEDVLPGPAGTGNVHLMNVFSTIRPRGPFPYRLGQLCVFLQLTDAAGEVAIHIEGRPATSDIPTFAVPSRRILFDDRLQTRWVLFRIRDCPFPHPARYLVECCCNDQPIADQIIDVLG